MGHLAVQLAVAMGAYVTGLLRQERHAAAVREVGAHAVVDDDGAAASANGPYHLILESVGGRTLGNALEMVTPGGTCVSLGVSGGESATFDARQFFGTGRARLYGFTLFQELAHKPAAGGLDRLAHLVADGRLRPHIDIEAPWTEIDDVAQRLIDRRFAGKAVLQVAR